jgi:YidC/Oxa1 family membrane protein insertase
MMDKRTISAFILIGLIFFAWSFFFTPKPTPPAKKNDTTAQKSDNTPLPNTPPPQQQAPPETRYSGTPYATHLAGEQRFVTVETPLYKAILNTKGGLLARFELKKYRSWYGAPVQLISDSTGFPGELGITFRTRDGKEVSTEDLTFSIDAPEKISLGEKDSVVITARLPLADSAMTTDSNAQSPARAIEKRFVFHGNDYTVGFDVTMQNMADQIGGSAYQINWKQGLKYQEHNSVDESAKAKTLLSINHDITEFDEHEAGKSKEEKYTGPIDWIGLTVRYFGFAMIPSTPIPNAAATVTGRAAAADSSGLVETYSVALQVPYAQPTETRSFKLFIGPLEYPIVKEQGLQAMIDIGARWIVRPIGEFFMLPVFRALHSFIANYGVVIIVFSLIIRALLWPLSIPQIKSSRKMQLLQPKIAEIRAKFSDDQQRQQMETMNIYREYGINPVSGCLPLVLQMPILYALWATLSSSIELRQASFALWIHDLSIPDIAVTLPFSLPLLGNQLSGLALIMGATLFIQQKMMITDPKQKAMIYFMPVLLTLMFNHLPSGLNLYYLMFNLLSIGQQIYMTKFSKSTVTLEDLKKQASTKKKGWLSQKMAEAQKMAEMQQTAGKSTSSGSKKVDGRTPVEPRRNRNAKS